MSELLEESGFGSFAPGNGGKFCFSGACARVINQRMISFRGQGT